MNNTTSILAMFIATQAAFAADSCKPTVSAADLQDGGLAFSSAYSVILPSTLPAIPFDGKPEEYIFSITALGIPNRRSFLQSNFAMAGANEANFRETLILHSAHLIQVGSISKLAFKKFRFTDGVSAVTNIQDLELYIRPTDSSNLFYFGGTWGGSRSKSPAFPELILDLNYRPLIIINWSKKTIAGGTATQLDISVPTNGYYELIYRAANDGLPAIEPFSSTVGTLSVQGLIPRASVLTFQSKQECMKDGALAACF